ncbi:toprim domain-containing protein [Patescibacteria group bacterium]|nr:toprim domain-containing protein [Patescibacteria group bacterium]
MIPKEIKKFVDYFSKLPLLGPRQATRLAFYLLESDKSSLKNLSEAMSDLLKLDRCARCFFIKEENEKLCPICSDEKRSPTVIAIVEKETDLMTFEKMSKFKGQYLVLGKLAEKGILEQTQKARLEKLKSRIKSELGGSADEIIIALNATAIGDFTSDIIREEFKNLSKKITRLGRGLPTGGEVEFADETTLLHSFEKRY